MRINKIKRYIPLNVLGLQGKVTRTDMGNRLTSLYRRKTKDARRRRDETTGK
jgi:hypothetical protein